ncbi:hypothetical protein BDN72DRAFT_210720 [Pluteus cervinus]|uniref:Uncharacterized protein n=1 Tax=Pluteus cervinus TaxID=181527 RepID=A0ACD3B6D6_9AGAR|nr:hypothetical protein BDN72DRAFT_210720 [Pluteus cervinus]
MKGSLILLCRGCPIFKISNFPYGPTRSSTKEQQLTRNLTPTSTRHKSALTNRITLLCSLSSGYYRRHDFSCLFVSGIHLFSGILYSFPVINVQLYSMNQS